MHRYIVYLLAILMFPICLWLATIWPAWYWGVGLTAAMVALGTWDLLQKRSTLRRNYPVMAHFRYGLESIGPEIRQYFIERDTERAPFSREQRARVYQRSKGVQDTVPRGLVPPAALKAARDPFSVLWWKPSRDSVARVTELAAEVVACLEEGDVVGPGEDVGGGQAGDPATNDGCGGSRGSISGLCHVVRSNGGRRGDLTGSAPKGRKDCSTFVQKVG